MTAVEIWIIVMAAVQVLALLVLGMTGLLIYQRVQEVAGWGRPALRESRVIAARGKATALQTKSRAQVFVRTVRGLIQHVSRRVQTTTRLAREVVHPDLPPLQQAARSLAGPNGLAARLSRLHEAGKIAAGQGNGHDTHG